MAPFVVRLVAPPWFGPSGGPAPSVIERLGLAVAFGVWQVRGLYALSSRLDVVEYSMDQGDRFTASDGLALEGRLREWHIADVEYRTRQAQRDWVGVDSHIHLRIDAIERKVHTHLREQGYYEEIMEDN